MGTIELIQGTLVPVVLITAIALVDLTLDTRYGRIVNRVRELLKEMRDSQESLPPNVKKKRIGNIELQINVLFKRGRLLKWALLFMHFSIASLIALSITIFYAIIENLVLQVAILGLYALSMLFILVGSILTVIEITQSLSGLSLEIKLEKEQ